MRFKKKGARLVVSCVGHGVRLRRALQRMADVKVGYVSPPLWGLERTAPLKMATQAPAWCAAARGRSSRLERPTIEMSQGLWPEHGPHPKPPVTAGRQGMWLVQCRRCGPAARDTNGWRRLLTGPCQPDEAADITWEDVRERALAASWRRIGATRG